MSRCAMGWAVASWRYVGGPGDCGPDGALPAAAGRPDARRVADGERGANGPHHAHRARLPSGSMLDPDAGTPPPLIRVDALTKRFGGIVALDALTLDVAPGIVGLVGANGAGKSTLIKILLGLLAPTSGRVEVMGYVPETQGTLLRRYVGYMPEHPALPPDVSATEFVAQAGRLSGLPAKVARERTADVLRHVGLAEERYRPIGGYSTGMRQRVQLAQAIVHDPQAAPPRRADERARPGRPRRDARPHPPDRDRVRDRDRPGQPPPRRDRGGLRPSRGDRRRAPPPGGPDGRVHGRDRAS